jgi:hypothetical protein
MAHILEFFTKFAEGYYRQPSRRVLALPGIPMTTLTNIAHGLNTATRILDNNLNTDPAELIGYEDGLPVWHWELIDAALAFLG